MVKRKLSMSKGAIAKRKSSRETRAAVKSQVRRSASLEKLPIIGRRHTSQKRKKKLENIAAFNSAVRSAVRLGADVGMAAAAGGKSGGKKGAVVLGVRELIKRLAK